MDLEQTSESTEDHVVRLSLGWLLLGGLAVIGLSVLGGFVAVQLLPVRQPLIAPEGSQLLTTVQEVTVSPSIAATQLVQDVHRSVVLLRDESENDVATGVVVTNDGLIVTANQPSTDNVRAFDYQGVPLETEFIGEDALFGLSFFRVTNGVLLPLDLRSDAILPGSNLWAIGRNATTFAPRIADFTVSELALPAELMPRGISQVLRSFATVDTTLTGSPLLDEAGKLAGLLLNPDAGFGLPASLLRTSINRITSGQREVNPFTDLGITVRYTFAALRDDETPRFALEVTTVASGSPAADAKIARGDLLFAINEEPLSWDNSVVASISQDRPFDLTLRRGTSAQVVTVFD